MKPYFKTESGVLYHGDCIEVMKQLPEKSIQCCITSPPYWGLRDYGVPGQLGLEETPELFIEKMVLVFREVKRILKDDGTIWVNFGDSYMASPNPDKGDAKYTGRKRFDRPNTHKITGLKKKDLVGIPWRFALALQADGWYLRQDIIWSKPNPMPESVKDRCTKAHEYIFLLSKSSRYYFDNVAIKEPAGEKGNANSFRGGSYCNGNKDNNTLGKRTTTGNKKVKIPSGWETGKGAHGNYHKNGRGKSAYSFARKTATKGKPGTPNQHREDREKVEYFGSRNKRSVWTVSTKSFKEAHFATFPPALITPCILAGCPEGGVVFDPFFGSGTTGLTAYNLDRNFLGIELNTEYCEMATKRIKTETKQLKLF